MNGRVVLELRKTKAYNFCESDNSARLLVVSDQAMELTQSDCTILLKYLSGGKFDEFGPLIGRLVAVDMLSDAFKIKTKLVTCSPVLKDPLSWEQFEGPETPEI